MMSRRSVRPVIPLALGQEFGWQIHKGAPILTAPAAAGRRTEVFARLLSLFIFLILLLPLPVVAQTNPPETQEAAAPSEPELDFSDVLFTRNPIPATDVELKYRFERDRQRTDTGISVTHKHEVDLDLSLAATDWLGLSVALPYQVLDVHAPGGQGTTETRNLGDITTEAFVTFFRDPARKLALATGLDLGLPTGSIHEGTGGQWTLTPFVGSGTMLGPFQILADVGFTAELRSLPRANERKRELSYNVAGAYPLFGQWALPFLEINGAYAFHGTPEIRHRAQLYLSPGIRLGPAAVAGMPEEVRGAEKAPSAGSSAKPEPRTPPWWKRLSLALAAQFPVTSAREFEWALTSALKLDF